MRFMKLNYVAVIRKATGRDTPRMVRLIIGNPVVRENSGRR
jgi:hypothetical protein